MTVAQILQEVKQFDSLAGEVLLAHVLGTTKEDLFAHPQRPVTRRNSAVFAQLYRRLKAGEPLAYLTGTKEFYGLEFHVNPSVLIPRPETELLVDKILDFAAGEQRLKVLDVGTGSGAIAVSLAKNLLQARLVATDVSPKALEVARRNAEKHGVGDRVTFVEADLLAGMNGPFDVVVANLPYIGEEQFRFVSREAQEYEPHVALFGGPNGLALYKRLFAQLSAADWRPRLFLGEFGFLQGEEMRNLLNTFFEQEEWRIEKDYASIERVFVIPFQRL